MILHITRRDGTKLDMFVQVGYQLQGLRVDSVTIEGPEELQKLLSDKGREWCANHLGRAFKADNPK